jgi:protein-S-isoprenylcysteine O-methyltransferase Ste14
MSTVVDRPQPSPPLTGLSPHLGRTAGAVWFLLLALLYAGGAPSLVRAAQGAGFSFAAWAPVVSRGCTMAFFVTLAWLMIARPTAVARRSGPVTLMIALEGTYGVWLVAFLPQAPLPPSLTVLSAAMTLVGSALIIYTVLHLGRSFSIAPQARELVTRGPYALVRHPLYAAEEIALVGVAMHVAWYAALPFLAVHLALQIKRMNYEEQLLREVFPRYAAYAGRTARWVPSLW